MTEVFNDELKRGLSELSLCISEAQRDMLYDYYRMVIEKNKVMNLTAITEEKDFVLKHIVDSLAIVKAGTQITSLLCNKGSRLIDIGTGAGLPGIVLRIVFPEPEILLFDSLKKRLSFLDEVIGELCLKSCSVLHGRAEDLGRDTAFRESFDLAVCRAVARMNVLSEYALPLVKPGGYFVAYKSADVEEELSQASNALGMLGGKSEAPVFFELPGSDMARSIVSVKKIKPTPDAYPRKAGIPVKKPIC